ncbi:MAG: bacteriophage holin [Simkaniaceae bacterium]
MSFSRFNLKAFALAFGIVWGLANLIVGWTSIFGWGNAYVETLSSIYIGYDASFIGGIVGGIWAFADGVIGGLVFAFFYNLILGKKP